jgi:NADPH:quinone reductase-like Zn-dependent oxidoreductase
VLAVRIHQHGGPEKIADAHRYLEESRHRGKVVVTFPGNRA